MAYFTDYVGPGLCCQQCGVVVDGEEPGYPRTCEDCASENDAEQAP